MIAPMHCRRALLEGKRACALFRNGIIMHRTRLPVGSLFGILSVTTLIAVGLFAAAGACAWAVSGLLDLNSTASYILAVIVGIPSLVLVGKVARLAIESELAMVQSANRGA
jgi:hypothetical protein